MEALSGVASVTAVIDISVKIASLCYQYSVAVKDAKKDIECFLERVVRLKNALKGVTELMARRDGTRLSVTHKLAGSLNDCGLLLEELEAKLGPSKNRRAVSRLGGRALKWPFTSKEVGRIAVKLQECEQTFILVLQVDQTWVFRYSHVEVQSRTANKSYWYRDLILDINQKMDFVDKIDLPKLPIAKGASFDSHMEEHNARCLENTRVKLQNQIAEWAKDRSGRPMFWLNGMAGTGKSTIARTVAQSFADKGQLGASFFFKRGVGDCGNAARFFTTIATDLMIHLPGLIPGIRKAIQTDPAISERSLKDQFEKLIFQSLSEIQKVPPQALSLVVVIDALDECDREDDIRTILKLLARTKDITPLSLQVFLTSRPELPIRLGFKQMSDKTYQDLILHEIPQQTIEQDIVLYLEYELRMIREQRSLSSHWPGKDQFQTLVKMAIPFFIFAATACKYIGDNRGNPKRRLEIVLQYQTASQVSKLDKTYLPIIE
ncbi:hypothetical protein MMC07_003539 [Pseudocyphellaria aurata]|nr:hypothetical protein [Pseudocyphellaria aurata]